MQPTLDRAHSLETADGNRRFTDTWVDTSICVDTWLENIHMFEGGDPQRVHSLKLILLVDFLIIHNEWTSDKASRALDQLHAAIMESIDSEYENQAA